MPKEYPTEVVQPPGEHNKPSECVLSESISDYLQVPFSHLNPVQSLFVPHLEDDDFNIVISAATSSGKTLCAELFSARALALGKKVLYIAPMKALTDEKYYEWQDPSHTFSDRHIEILTGDFVLSDAKRKSLEQAEIIFLTPEMFNSKCRYYDSHEWLQNAWIIGDEIHLLGSKNRGDKLEIGLIQYFENAPETRTLMLSATIPNVQDFADWLEHNTSRKSIILKSNYRPCKLQTDFVSFSDINRFGRPMVYDEKEMARLDKVVELVNEHGDDPLIVFVGSKDFGRRLSERLGSLNVSHEFHNADKNREAKNKIEQRFRDLDFNVLIATTTVAWGCGRGNTKILCEDGKEIEISKIGNDSKLVSFSKKIPQEFDCGRPFVKKIVTDNKIKVKRVTTKKFGYSIEFTEDHVIPLASGEEKAIGDLVVGDVVWTCSGSKGSFRFERDKIASVEYIDIGDEYVYDLSVINKPLEDLVAPHTYEDHSIHMKYYKEKERHHYYCANGIVVHNCNTPARHVILSHTSFGLTKMEPQDVHQAIGRAGRLGYSDRGDAHILVSKREMAEEQSRLFGKYEVKSTLNDVNILIFHILSYIENGHIKNAEDLFEWYSRTLASIQKERLGIETFKMPTAQKVLDNLESRKMIKKNKNEDYEATEMGQITARMYMSPLDVSDWFRNFSTLPAINPSGGSSEAKKDALNVVVSMAFADCYSWGKAGTAYISKAEQRTRAVNDIMEKLSKHNLVQWEHLKHNPHVKYAAIFYSLLNGKQIDNALQSISFGIQQDIGRIINTMKQIDMRYGVYFKRNKKCKGFGWGEDWDKLMFRLRYPGIAPALWGLVSIQGIGQAFATKLFKAGIKTKEDFTNDSNRETIRDILGDKRTSSALKSLGVDSLELEKKPRRKISKSKKTPVRKKASKKKMSSTKDLF